MNSKTRLWQHDGLWRIQDHHQLTDRHGVAHDVWESRRDENSVLFFETEDQARVYLQCGKKEDKHGQLHDT